MELYLIRHPRPQVAPGTCYGQLDLPLAEDPVQVAERLRPLLPAHYALHASPLQRARLLAEALGAPQVDARLMEIHFGAWEGQRYDDLGSALDAWVEAPLDFAAPGGESPRQMAARVQGWLDELLASPPPAVVVVAHGGPLRSIAGSLLRVPPVLWIHSEHAKREGSAVL